MADILHWQVVKAPVSEVYRSLTTREGLAEVWTRELEVTQEIGAQLAFQFGSNDITKMKLKELVPDRRIVWECVDSDPEWIGTSIVFELTEKNGATTIDFAQLNWSAVTPFYKSCNYNWAMFLYSLKLYCEQGKGMPYQDRTF